MKKEDEYAPNYDCKKRGCDHFDPTNTPTSKCCDSPRKTISVSTRKGRRVICNNCGAPWPKKEPTPTTDSKNSSEDWEDKFKAFRGSCTCSGPKLSCSSCPSNDSYISFIQHIAKEEYERGFEFGQKVGRKGAVEFIKKEMQLDKSASPTTVLMLPLNVLEAALETPSNPT